MAATSIHVSRQLRRRSAVAGVLKSFDTFLEVAEGSLFPILDLALRLWLAQIFWVSGLLKLHDWDTALRLATYEYPVAWLDPATAAVLGVAVETIAPVFLALGLATRPAALALLALSLVIQLEYQALNQHLYWAVLLGGYVLLGAGPLSLDRLLGRGLADSALPLARPLGRLSGALGAHGGPVYLLALRLVLAGMLLALLWPAARIGVLGFQPPAALPASDSGGALLLGGVIPALLAPGLATRIGAVLAAVLLAGGMMSASPSALELIDYRYWLLLLVLLALRGPGALYVDRLLAERLRARFPALESLPAELAEALPQVVIVGAGFGGLAAARALRKADCRVTLIDQRNYHLFQPLLYQVATAVLSPADIATPVRELVRDQPNARVVFGRVGGVDTIRREVLLDGQRLPYDYLVLATGARHSYFGRDEWGPYAPGLKQVEDATEVRRRLLLAFEEAENCDDPAGRERLLTFVIVGGGPTGVELAGAIAELARHGMAGEFRRIDPARARIVLVQSDQRLLPVFPDALSGVARRDLEALGVEVLTGSRVERVDAAGVVVSGQPIPAGTVLWAAGVMASPAAQWVDGESDRSGRLKVGPDLSVPGHGEIFAVGDTALAEGPDGRPVPGLAPAAKQGGDYVARVIRARLEERPAPGPFRYRHKGSLATIGRKSAVADFGALRLHGAPAWWLWGAVHVFFLAGMRNRVSVALEWFWAYLTFRRGTRLITGQRQAES